MFWPHVIDQPFHFQCVATDLDGRPIAFDMPMIFMDNTLACPVWRPTRTVCATGFRQRRDPCADRADGLPWRRRQARRPFRRQRVALATSTKAGDTLGRDRERHL